VHNVRGVRQIDVHTAEHLVPGPSHTDVETDNAMLRKNILRGNAQILKQLIQMGCEILWFAIHTHSVILFGIRKNCLAGGRSHYCTN
jgi:hypothetical protein